MINMFFQFIGYFIQRWISNEKIIFFFFFQYKYLPYNAHITAAFSSNFWYGSARILLLPTSYEYNGISIKGGMD